MTAIYSTLHLLVDGICALAMFGSLLLREDGYFLILIYNFCAFALQMPLGVLLDMVNREREGKNYGRDPAFWTAAAGVLLTVAGALLHPALLGLGNALFHVGGGVGCIREDERKNWQGRGLGVFVAPGALGLYLGTWMAGQNVWLEGYLGASLFAAALCLGTWLVPKVRGNRAAGTGAGGRECGNKAAGTGAGESVCGNRAAETGAGGREDGKGRTGIGGERLKRGRLLGGRRLLWAAVCCVLVVMLRSYIGMAVTFPWKSGFGAGLLAVVAVAGGKAAGGAVRWGTARTAVLSLGPAALCYLFSGFMPLGLAALFLFNMTMPVTLYWMVRSMPQMPGFAFGLLTFALFLGFLPGYFGMPALLENSVTGFMGCILSMFLLVIATGGREK